MMDKLLTIVIPAYNMENYLHRCLDSLIIEKSDCFNKLEVLIINDGSKDSTSAIAHEYQKKYPHVFRAIDKENGNYGSCVNRGLDEAVGKYFRLLDADDYVDKRALLDLVVKIESFDSEPDLIITNYQEDHADGYTKYIVNDQYEYNKIYDFDNVVLGRQKNGYLSVMHRMTYKLDVVRKAGLRHLEGISYTDSEYCFYPLRKVKTIMFVNLLLYRYQIGREGQTVSESSYQKNIHNLYKIIDRMLNSFTPEDKAKSYYRSLIIILEVCLVLYYKIILTGRFDHHEDLKTMDNRVLEFDKDLFNKIGKAKKSRIVPVVALWRKGFKTNSDLFRIGYRLIDRLALMYKKTIDG